MKSFLIFKSHSVNFAVPSDNVKSIFWLPELSAAEAVPDWIVGHANIHGDIVRVVDLGKRFGHARRPYTSLTNLIWATTSGARFAIIADTVQGLVEFSAELLEKKTLSTNTEEKTHYSELVSDELKLNDEVVLLLNMEKLFNFSLTHELDDQTNKSQSDSLPLPDELSHLFRTRMHQLANAVTIQTNQNLKGFAIVQIGGIAYAIEMQYITEFTHLKQCTSIPCCPSHILGLINLRGEILSVIGMASLLKIDDLSDQNEAVILQFENKRMALAVQQVNDFRYFGEQNISALQDIDEHRARCKSLLRYDDQVAGILNLDDILLTELLEINEQV